jgi:hypothetical protein
MRRENNGVAPQMPVIASAARPQRHEKIETIENDVKGGSLSASARIPSS